jgi:hypothetical protein
MTMMSGSFRIAVAASSEVRPDDRAPTGVGGTADEAAPPAPSHADTNGRAAAAADLPAGFWGY